MKSHLLTLVLALLAGFAGGIGSQLFQLGPTPSEREDVDRTTDVPNPFQIKAESSGVALPLAQMQQKISRLETQLNQLAQARAAISSNPGAGSDFPDERPTPQQAPLASDEDYLAAVGVNPDVANDILRRISQQQFRSLELRNLMRTQDPSDRQADRIGRRATARAGAMGSHRKNHQASRPRSGSPGTERNFVSVDR